MPDESERYGLIPARLEGRLMAFQREGVRFALRHGGRALIGDEMGLGKTVQVLTQTCIMNCCSGFRVLISHKECLEPNAAEGFILIVTAWL